MRFSAVTAAFPCDTALIHGTFQEIFRSAKEAGFDCVQLTAKSPEELPLDELQALIAAFGVSVSAIATGRVYTADGLSMGSSDPRNRAMCVRRLCALSDCAKELDCAALVIGSVRGRFRDASGRDEYDRLFEESLREIVGYCETLGVPVILEAIDRLDADAYCDPAEVLRLVERIHSPALHMYLDVLHLYNEGFDIAGSIRTYAPHSWQIDLSGENRLSPRRSRIRFFDVAAAIRASGFDGLLTFEYPSDTPREELAYIKGLFTGRDSHEAGRE